MEALKKKTISFVFRHKLPENSSIEELFTSIRINLQARDLQCKHIELPVAGASFNNILKNLRYARSLKSDIFHITGDVHYIALSLKGPTVLTIHDIGSALQGNFLKRFMVKALWFWLPALIVNRITVISETSKNELEKIIPFAKNKIVVIHNPVNPSINKSLKETFDNIPIILHIGTKPNKNLLRTIEALEGIACKFVIIGKLNDEQIAKLNDCKIDYLNEYHINYEMIVHHYKNCDLVLFVSTYEGFGMPIIEAQKTGRPVISSNISSIPEIAGKGACLVDPFNVEEIRNAIQRVINNEDYRHQLIENGFKNIKRFEMDHITEQYLKIYRDLLN